jgi:hypothetical protein
MASVKITNLGGSIRLQDVRFYPDVTDVEILKDGLVLTQFGDICRIRFTNGIPFDATFDEYEIIGFDGSIIPTTTQECYDAIWAVLADYGNTSSGDCCACEESSYRLLEDGSLRLLEEGCVRLLEDYEPPAVSIDWGDITGTLSDQTDLQDALDAKVNSNTPITGATKTKITYDAKGLVTNGADAGISDITGLTTALGTKLDTTDLTRVLLMTQTAAASASIDFENLFTGAYSRFELEYDNVIPSLPSTLNFCIGIGSGPVVYQNGASDYSWFMRRYINNGSGTVATNLYAADNADTNVILYLFSSTTIESFSGKITFLNPFDASIKAKFLHETFCIYNIGVGNYLTTGNAFYKSTGSLITGMRIKLDSGTLTSGTFRLYGIK